MKKIIPLLFILSQNIPADVLRIIDPDTLAISAPYLPKPLKPELLLRINGIDSPEKGGKAKCEEEKLLEISAESFVKDLFQKYPIHEITLTDWDKYGGRVLGDVFFPKENTYLSTILIQKGFAKPYDGTKKESWCKSKHHFYR